jgi:hypothetical protein
VQDVFLIADFPRQPDILRLDRDPALTLDVHPVQVLRPHVTVCDDAGELEHPVGQRGLAVIDMGDDAEVPNLRRRGERLVGETADGNLLVWAMPGVLERRFAGVSSVSIRGGRD